jgi:leucyl aminopeptidase
MLDSRPIPSPQLSTTDDPFSQAADVLILGIGNGRELGPTLERVDTAGNGWISRLIERKKVPQKRGEALLLAPPTASGPTMIMLVGLGSDEERDRQCAFDITATAIRKLTDQPQKEVIIALAESFPPSQHDAIVAGALCACEGTGIYQAEASLQIPAAISFTAIEVANLDRGKVIGESINHTRRLVNEPPSVLYPQTFADRAAALAKETNLSIEIWDEHKLAAENCRAILAVGSGSTKPPRLVILRYQGGGDQTPLALVGKGVTFDSGGLSLKPSEGMQSMKCDMAGAATVLGVLHAIAKLGLRCNVIGLCGLAENMVSGDSYKLGDVIQTRSGKTIEILNTDAEGRVVLADTLDVAVQMKPAAIVDLATLTGACLVALGTEVAGLMTNDQSICDQVQAAAELEGEPVWQLPMFKLYNEKVKSKVADIKNIGEGRWGGAITAAKFLENFVDDVPWLHIDIAGPAFADSPKPHRDAGATGVMVRTLIRWIESRS